MARQVAEGWIDIAGVIGEFVGTAAAAAVALDPAVAVLDQEYCSKKLHLDRQQVIPQVQKGHKLAVEKGRSWVFVERS